MALLSSAQESYLTDLRHDLHRFPEISGEEKNTSDRIALELEKLGADRIWRNLGGHGLAGEFRGATPGQTVLFRCELDGLPITENSQLPYRSEIEGKGHLCGHDGHMSMNLGLGMALARRPSTGRVILLFQPAEETGKGAKAVISDQAWADIRPDFAFAYHNVPGRPLGEIGIREGIANCASRGLQILLEGKSSHAAAPQDGLSPADAMATLMQSLPRLGGGRLKDEDFGLSTLTHACLGEPTFGIAPGLGEVRLTLRSRTDARMEGLMAEALSIIKSSCSALKTETHLHDVFPALVNGLSAIEVCRAAVSKTGMLGFDMPTPMSWSEDFAHFGLDGAHSALIFIGAGEGQPQLHNPDYDFPDALISPATKLSDQIVRLLLG